MKISANMIKALALIGAGETSIESSPHSPLKPQTVKALENRGLVRITTVTPEGRGYFNHPAVYRVDITKAGREAL